MSELTNYRHLAMSRRRSLVGRYQAVSMRKKSATGKQQTKTSARTQPAHLMTIFSPVARLECCCRPRVVTQHLVPDMRLCHACCACLAIIMIGIDSSEEVKNDKEDER